MQVSEMSFHHIIRSQSSLIFQPSKFKLFYPSINSLRLLIQPFNQNPNISSHFRLIHSITPKSSPESPLIDVDIASEETPSSSTPQQSISETTTGVWSIYNTVKPVNSNREEEGVGNKVNLSSSLVESAALRDSVGKENPSSSTPPESFPETTAGVWSVYNTVKPVNSNSEEGGVGNKVNLRDFVGKGKKEKSKVNWVCSYCGHSEGQWWGTCKSCNKVGTLQRVSVSKSEVRQGRVSGSEVSENVMRRSWVPASMDEVNLPVRLTDINRAINHLEWRIRLSGMFGLEVNRVLGSGVVPGSLILVGGDPGVGKSTLALQMISHIAESCDVGGGGAPVVYVSGEESVEQIGNRADRLSIDTEDLFLYSSTDVKDILEKVQILSPRAVVVDSIQTMYLKEVQGSPGGLTQVKECAAALLRFAKSTQVPVLLIGHVNKTGDIAGPRVLEHIVDVVLYMEGEKNSSHRLLRAAKNRFGATDELGVFEMSESGLDGVANSSEMFLSEEHSDSAHLAGVAVAVIIDGSRTFLVEVQALCVSGSVASKHVNGVQPSRADMILAVLKKQAGLKLEDHSVFLNVVNGVSLTETSGDLAVAAAICSSFLEFPLPNNMAFIGEIGLGGELRTVPSIERRVHTVAQLGYKKCVVPESALKALTAISSEIQIIGCKNLKEVIDSVFKTED